MKINYRYIAVPILALALSATFSCKKKQSDPEPELATDGTKIETATTYSAILCVGAWPNTAYYIANIPSLTSGTIDIKGNGAELTGKVYAQDVVQRNGFYYHLNAGAGRFGKYHVNNGKLVTDVEIPFNTLNWDSYAWVDDATLVVFGSNGDGNEGRYAVVKVATMDITSTGKLDLTAFPTGFSRVAISAAEYRNGKFFLSYGFGSTDWTKYPDMDFYKPGYVAVVDYTTMKVEKNLTFSKLFGTGGPTVYAKTSFIDENNDIYFVTDPSYNYDYESPSTVFRIKNGSTELDSSYAFNFSATVGNDMAPAMWYIGAGKAIIRTRLAGKSIDADHSFSIVNVHTGTFIKKLDLPADKGERMVQAVIVENGKAHIAVNAADRDFIWIYDPATDQLTKGAEFVGGIDYILRLEKTR